MSEKDTVRLSKDELGSGRTDWERLDRMTEEEIEANARADLDNPPWTEEDFRNAELLMPTAGAKEPVYIRLDQEILDYFRDEGPGYQSRINAVLLGYVRGRRKRAG